MLPGFEAARRHLEVRRGRSGDHHRVYFLVGKNRLQVGGGIHAGIKPRHEIAPFLGEIDSGLHAATRVSDEIPKEIGTPVTDAGLRYDEGLGN